MTNEEIWGFYELIVLSAKNYRASGEDELANIDGRIATDILRRLSHVKD